ncbi:hypothetical protein SDC9_167804 [bioreactor metagenome]|uniref:Uncharacterized protein n=1 Tax=bioreactor metagenome TaxID=1076179 RepID=A0A645G1A3_9ZZZZ
MIQREQDEGFNELGLYGRSLYRQDGFSGENRRSFRNGIDIAAEMKAGKIAEEFFAKNIFLPQEFNVFRREMQIFDILNHLLQACGNGETAAVWHLPEKYVEISDAPVKTGFPITVPHGQFIKVT